MIIHEKIEIAIILVLGFIVFSLRNVLPNDAEVGRLLLGTSALLLFQSLVRDLWLLSRSKGANKMKPQRKIRCMCIESTVGAVGVLIGLMLLGLGVNISLTMAGWAWAMIVVLVLAVGLCVKDYVLEWRPWRIYRDKDHINIAFTWKSSENQSNKTSE